MVDDGQWVTINGTHILIKDGESKEDAISEFTSAKGHDGASEKQRQIDENKKEADRLNAKKDEQSKPTIESKEEKDAKTYSDTLVKARESNPDEDKWRVDVHDTKDYENTKNFVTQNGSTVSVTKDGDIISVCKNCDKGIRGEGKALLALAVKNGGVKLDSFSGNHAFYEKCGFQAVCYIPFDKDQVSKDWSSPRDSEEPVVFYKYVGVGNVKSIDKSTFSSDTKNVIPCFTGKDCYSKATDYRDSKIKK